MRNSLFVFFSLIFFYSIVASADPSLCQQYLRDSIEPYRQADKLLPFTIKQDGTIEMNRKNVSFEKKGNVIEYHFNADSGVNAIEVDRKFKLFLDEKGRLLTWQQYEITGVAHVAGTGKPIGREVTFYWLDNGKCIPQHEQTFVDDAFDVAYDLQDCRTLKAYYTNKPLLKRCNCATPKSPGSAVNYKFEDINWQKGCGLSASQKVSIFDACSAKEDQNNLRAIVGESKIFRAFPVLSWASTRYDECVKAPVQAAMTAFDSQKGSAASAKYSGRGAQ